MTAALRNEIEERRVIRLLAHLADDFPPLQNDEIERLVESASAPAWSGRRRAQRPARYFSAVAAAAVVALAFLVQVEGPTQDSSSGASGRAAIATFAEGNALQLLLSARETRNR